MFSDLSLISVIRWLIKDSAFHTVRQILLLYIVPGVIVCIKITISMAQIGSPPVVTILKMNRNRIGACSLYRIHSGLNGQTGGIALGGTGHIGHGL